MTYRPVTSAVLTRLRELTALDRVITDPAALFDYGRDESPGPSYPPEALVKVCSAEEVAGILALCRDERIPVTPRGLGTGLAGGSVPVQRGIMISTELMNTLIEVDTNNLTVRTEPGVTTDRVQKTCAEHGLYYPVDPASLEDCSIGGNIATNAGGARAFKYGVTADYVRGLEAVLPDGRLIRWGGKILKNATGYGLGRLLVGSEGTLAVITEVVLRLVPKPKYQIDVLIPFTRLHQGIELVLRLVHDDRLLPAVVEFVERQGIRATNQVLGSNLPFADAEVQVLVELEGNNRDQVLEDCVRLGEMAMELGAKEPLVADNPTDQTRLWTARRKLADTLKQLYPEVTAEDIVVPLNDLPATVEEIARLQAKYGLIVVPFGHIGDGNIHVDICREDDRPGWREARDRLLDELVGFVLSHGGQISAEHGIGSEKRKWMKRALGANELELMRRLKHAIDPDRILNPGKILPD
ncbi:MAG: FAD-binding oxidoreductase [candidate division WOR-3 bacterium]